MNHVVYVHQTVGVFSKTFLQKLRRVNYTTPKNYLDFINTYNKLLEEKDKFVLEQVSLTWLLGTRIIQADRLIAFALRIETTKKVVKF